MQICMKTSKLNLIIAIISVTYIFFLQPSKLLADIQISYKNIKNPAQIIEISMNNDNFRVNSTKNITKIVNFEKNELILYKNDEKYFTKVKIKENEINKTGNSKADELFSPKLVKIGEKKIFAKIPSVAFKYTSEIDPSYKIYATDKYKKELIDKFIEALSCIHETGIEILKSPPYYYSLKNGFLPLKITSKDLNWEATKVSEVMLSQAIFKAPEEKKFISDKEYFHKIVEHVYKQMQSEVTR